jgi:outer membrane protein TolC
MNTLRFLLALASAMVMAVAPARANAGTLAELLAEALQHNPELAAARAGSEAAQQRVSYAAALEDPMLEAGIVNAPLPFSLRREDMTMKMLGLAQKLPFPGKRALRHDVAAADASSIAHAVDETADRVLRDVRAAYGELQLDTTARSLVSDTLVTLQQLESVAEARIASGQATQGDALQAQIELVTMQQELLRLDQE